MIDLTACNDVVLRSTILLTIAASLVSLAVIWRRSRSFRFDAACWSLVLLTGALLYPATLDIPWYEPAPAATIAAPTIDDIYRYEDAPGAKTTLAEEPIAAASAPTTEVRFGWSQLLALTWACGLLAVGIYSAVGYLGFLLALRQCWRPQKTWEQAYDRAARSMGVRRKPKLVVHASLGPCVCWTPWGSRLVIPSGPWTQLNANQRRAVLKHELAHYQRRDIWRALPARLVVLIHWFNPLAWFAAHRFDECSELAADRLALKGEPWLAGDLASALLRFAHDASRTRLLAPAARGRSLTRRLYQLIESNPANGEKKMLSTRIPLLILLSVLVAAGAIQVNLVAQEGDAEPPEGASRITAEAAKEFAGRIAAQDDLHKQLKEILQSDAGALALRDRAGRYEAEAREEMREEAIPQLLNSIFSEQGDKLTLRSDKQKFREQYLSAAEKTNRDIDVMLKTMQSMAAKMKPETELEKIVHRFMTSDTAPIILYHRQLRPQLRPGMKVVERLLENVFALRRDGKYAIRPDARPQAEERAKQYREFQKIFETFQADIADLSSDLSTHDEFHKNLSETFKEPLFIARLGAELIEGGRASRSKAERLIGQLEEMMREGADGLVLRDEGRDDVEEFVGEYERIKQAVGRMRQPLHQFAEQLADDDELHRTWRDLLKTDVALVRVAGGVEYATADAGDAVKEFLGRILNEDANGMVRVELAEIDEEELIDGISDMFRISRSARRRGRELNALTDKIADEAIRKAMQSPGGKVVFADLMTKHLASLVDDGFEQWIEEHFEDSGSGYIIRDGAEESIRELIEHVEDIKRELENADF